MSDGAAQSLWFLAPGLAHQLGNALFTLQGRARLLALGAPSGEVVREDQEADQKAILLGVERAGGTLHVLRWLLDETAPEPVPAMRVLALLAEPLRVPLRDRGLALEVQPAAEEAAEVAVDPGPWCRMLAALCRRLAAAAGPGPTGVLSLALQPAPAGVALEVSLRPAPGALPFPVDRGSILEQIREELRDAGGRSVPPGAGWLLRIEVEGQTLQS